MRLFGYERWMADAVARRQSVVRSRRVLWTERRFGDHGIELLAAGMVSVVVSEVIGIVGVVLLATARVPGAAVIGLAVVAMLIGVMRLAEATRVARSFRRSGGLHPR